MHFKIIALASFCIVLGTPVCASAPSDGKQVKELTLQAGSGGSACAGAIVATDSTQSKACTVSSAGPGAAAEAEEVDRAARRLELDVEHELHDMVYKNKKYLSSSISDSELNYFKNECNPQKLEAYLFAAIKMMRIKANLDAAILPKLDQDLAKMIDRMELVHKENTLLKAHVEAYEKANRDLNTELQSYKFKESRNIDAACDRARRDSQQHKEYYDMRDQNRKLNDINAKLTLDNFMLKNNQEIKLAAIKSSFWYRCCNWCYSDKDE